MKESNVEEIGNIKKIEIKRIEGGIVGFIERDEGILREKRIKEIMEGIEMLESLGVNVEEEFIGGDLRIEV